MSAFVLVRFPVPHRVVAEWISNNPSFLAPLGALYEKHGQIGRRVLTSDDEFIAIDEWPSSEAYAAFKIEANPYIQAFEAAFGHRSTERLYRIVR